MGERPFCLRFPLISLVSVADADGLGVQLVRIQTVAWRTRAGRHLGDLLWLCRLPFMNLIHSYSKSYSTYQVRPMVFLMNVLVLSKRAADIEPSWGKESSQAVAWSVSQHAFGTLNSLADISRTFWRQALFFFVAVPQKYPPKRPT